MNCASESRDEERVVTCDYIDYLLGSLTKIIRYRTCMFIEYAVVSERDLESLPTTFHAFCTIEVETDIGSTTHQIQINYFTSAKTMRTAYIEITHMIKFIDFLCGVFGRDKVNSILVNQRFQTQLKAELDTSFGDIPKYKSWNHENLN